MYLHIYKADPPKSQRYIEEGDENKGTDFNLPESMQNFLAKKLTEILKNQYEFHDISTNSKPSKDKNIYKNRVKLLRGDNCYVKPYEEFSYDIKGPDKKPTIKKRILDTESDNCKKEDQYKSVVVDGDYILSGAEVKMWAKKKERKNKIFYYKMSSHGALHEKEAINEFTELRRKNKWNENKIKSFKNKV